MTDNIEFRVMDFSCPSCASNVERALKKKDGVESAEVHYTTGRVEINYLEDEIDPDDLADIIKNQGYTPERK